MLLLRTGWARTAAACTYDYKLSGQQPEDGKSVVVNIKITKVLTITNTGACPFQPGTVLSETTINSAFTPISFTVPTAAPQATAVVSFDWPGRKTPGTLSRAFVMLDPKLAPIGRPMTFTLKYILGATPVPPPTATNPPAPATNTPPASAGLTDVGPAAVVACKYQGQNDMDYNCTIRLTYAGGSGRMTLSLDGQQVTAFQAGEGVFFNVVSRRCTPRPYNLTLVDDGTNSQVSKNYFFDPAANAGSFPGGGCILPP